MIQLLIFLSAAVQYEQ